MGRRLECGFCAHRFDVVSDTLQGVCPRCAARWSGLAGGLLDWDKPKEELKEKLKRLKSEKRYYVTKYALTLGILEVEQSDRYPFVSGSYLYFLYKDTKVQVGPKEWFTDASKAQARAEAMRTAKIASLEKQISKLRKKSFK